MSKKLSLLLLAAGGIALRGRIQEVVVSCGGPVLMPPRSRTARAAVTKKLAEKCPIRPPGDRQQRRPSQHPAGDAGGSAGQELLSAPPETAFVLQPILFPVDMMTKMVLVHGHPPQHVAAALSLALQWNCLLEFGPHCLSELARATSKEQRQKAFAKGLQVPGGKKHFRHELPLAVWRATSGVVGHLQVEGDDARSVFAGQCRLSAARNDGMALRETHHPFLLRPSATQSAVSGETIVAAEWPSRPPGSRSLPTLPPTVRSTAKEEDVAVADGRTKTRLLQQPDSPFWLLADASRRGNQRHSGVEGEADMICSPVRSVSRSNISLNLRGDRCADCVTTASALRARTSQSNDTVHPYLGSFLKVDRAPPVAWDAFGNSPSGKYPVCMKLPVSSQSPWFAAAETTMVRCSACGACGQLPRMLAHVATCRAGMVGRLDASTSRRLATLASPDGQNAEGGSSRALAAKTTSQCYDLAQLRIAIPAAASTPVPDQLWSRGLRFRLLCLNAARCLQSSWPLLVHEIRAILPLVVVVSEAEIPDGSVRTRIHLLIQWALQGRYIALFTANALVLVAHSLRPAPNTELAEIAGVPDVVSAVVAHPQIAGLLVLGYLPPTGHKYRAQRIEHHKVLLEFLRHRQTQLVGAAGDLNMSTGSVWSSGQRPRSAERQGIWNLLHAAGLQNGLDEHEATFPYADSQPDAVFLKPRAVSPPLLVYTDVDPPCYMKMDGSSHLRITAGIRNAPENARLDLPIAATSLPPADAALERRHIWATSVAPDHMLDAATAGCVAAALSGTFTASTIPQELRKAGVQKQKARLPQAPSLLFTATGTLTATTEEAMNVFKGRLCDGRPAGAWSSPAESAQLRQASDELIAGAPDIPVEATHDLAERAASRLNPRAAPGTDGVPPSFLLRAPRLIYSLALLFVSCINLFADLPWAKEYGVAWLYKVGKRGATLFLPTFWRPISMISVIDKLAEAVVLEQILPLVSSVRDNFAFHAGISPAVGLLRALTRTLLSDAKYVAVIIADISGGYENAILFDVLTALKSRGASRQILRAVWWWFQNRVCRIMLGGRLSAAFVIAEGLGQGTLLSPVLFRLVVEFWMEAHGIITTLLDTVTGYCDDICIFVVAETEAEMIARLTARGNEMLGLKFPLADWRIGVLRSPELVSGRERDIGRFLRRVEVKLSNGTSLRPPEVLSRMSDAEAGGNLATAYRPAECVKFLGIPLTTSPAAWRVHFDGLEYAVRAQEHAIIALAKAGKLSPLQVIDKYHERVYNLLAYMGSVKSVLWEESLQRSDEIAEGSLRRLLAVSSSAPAYSTFLSAGAQIPSTAALAERATAAVMAEAIDDEQFRRSAKVEDCFQFFQAGWRSLPLSLGLGLGVGLPDNTIVLRDRDAFQLYKTPFVRTNTPLVAALVREKMEMLDRTLGPALLLVGTDSGDAEQEEFMEEVRGAPPDKMATVVMRRGRDRPAAASVALRLRHKYATFLGEAGGLGVALESLVDSTLDPDAAINDPRLKLIVFQVDSSPVLANLRSNRPEDMWRGLRVLLRRLAQHRPDVAFVLHWVPGHAGISPHSEADILQKLHLPDLPLRDFCPQLSVPLRLVREHIRKNLRETVVKEVETRGASSVSGCMRGTMAAHFGSLRKWLKGLEPGQQQLVWSVLSGDGRAAAKTLGATVGADYVRCNLCGRHVESCIVLKRGQESQPIDARVDLGHDERPYEEIQAAAAAMAGLWAPMDANGVEEEADPASQADLTSDSEVAPASQDPAGQDEEVADPGVDQEGTKRHILLAGFARHLLANECQPVAEARCRLAGAVGSLHENMLDPEWTLRAVLEAAGTPAPDEWPLAADPRPERDDPQPSHETMHNIKVSAQACTDNIEALRTRRPPPSATQEAGPPAGPGRLLPSSFHLRATAPPDMTQPPVDSDGWRAAAALLQRNLDPRPRRPAPANRAQFVLDDGGSRYVGPVALPPAPNIDMEDDLLADDDDWRELRAGEEAFDDVEPAAPRERLEARAANAIVAEDLDPVTGLPVGGGRENPVGAAFPLAAPPDDPANAPVPMEVDDEGVDHMEWAAEDGQAAWENRRRAEREGLEEQDMM